MLREHVQFFMKSLQIVEIWEVYFFCGGGVLIFVKIEIFWKGGGGEF